ncbi:MAG: hypothetical protein GZ091_07000 [Paludibacter sp.]|nr:hypothetical protein [Paludibacter sp.]
MSIRNSNCLIILFLFFSVHLIGAEFYSSKTDVLANGKSFQFWEKKTEYKHTYFVNQNDKNASDENDGSLTRPFKSINKAAQILQPGERVLISSGVYRESVLPKFGGLSANNMISYEAAKGDTVIICGSVILPTSLFQKSQGWKFGQDENNDVNVWQFNLLPEWFGGYNPFGMLNLPNDIEWLNYKQAKMNAHFQRRGLIFIDNEKALQVSTPADLSKAPNLSFWVEHNGMRIHIKLPKGKSPSDYKFEATNKEQVFAPTIYGLGYIHIKGITFRHAGNGFPVPQRGMVSTARGHHWIIEDCTLEWANSVGLDMGNESWSTVEQSIIANHVIRRNTIRNCGISGLQCSRAKSMLVEDNLFENIGFHDAEHAFESGGIKFHQAENCLIRRNIFSKITHAPGLWLDYKSNKNCRITSNLFSEITTARGGIYIEVSRNNCLVDHNIFYKMRSQYWLSGEYGAGGSAFYTDGSDSINFENNLIIDAENTGYGAYLNAERIVDMRGGITSYHRVVGNIFIDCKKHAIEFANVNNYSNNNLFVSPRAGYIKIGNPAPALLLDIDATRSLYKWDLNSKTVKMDYQFDEVNKTCTLILKNEIPTIDMVNLKIGINVINVDPRKEP